LFIEQKYLVGGYGGYVLFLGFLRSFDFHQVHNMLALMLDPCFKTLQVVENYVGRENVIHLLVEYDVKEIIPFLMTIFEWLNPTIEAKVIATPCDAFANEGDEENMFGVGTSMKKSSHALVSEELSLF
jgi:hypothetical protein